MLLTLLNAASRVNVEQILDKLLNWGIDAGKSIIGAILIYVIGRFVIKQINRLVCKILTKRKLEISVQTFCRSLVNLLLNSGTCLCHHQQTWSRDYESGGLAGFCGCGYRYGIVGQPL